MNEQVDTSGSRYWVNIVALEHVEKSVAEGYVQAAKGEGIFASGDYVVFYSPRTHFRNGKSLQEFTAMGIVGPAIADGDKPKGVSAPCFTMEFFSSRRAAIQPMVEELTFLPDKEKWELPYRRGAFSISKDDYSRIAEAMARSAAPTDDD